MTALAWLLVVTLPAIFLAGLSVPLALQLGWRTAALIVGTTLLITGLLVAGAYGFTWALMQVTA